MPSVEMRRTTRVFGARVLRSGRRLFTSQDELKHMRRPPVAVAGDGDEWIELLDHAAAAAAGGGGDVEFKEIGWRNSNEENKNGNDEIVDIEFDNSNSISNSNEDVDRKIENFRWGVVYSRKRKRDVSNSGSPENIPVSGSDRKFGKTFIRKQPRKKIIADESPPATERNQSPIKIKIEPGLPENPESKRKKTRRVSGFNFPSRNGAIHRGIQRKRSSLRSRNRNLDHTRPCAGLVPDGVPFYPIKSNTDISRSIHRANFKELKSTLVELTQDIDSASCNANILVIESDRCYRELGGVITMEMSGSKQWFLVVKRDGVERFRVDAQHAMRPCFCNRVTHSIIWACGDDSWKLEFPNRQDWFVFKELYRKCSERTTRVQTPITSIIPVPRVSEVSGYVDMAYTPFKMPDSYIHSVGDEVTRVLESSKPIYDMDSDDDEWLNKFNIERAGDSRVDEDTFEKIIDGFERGMYSSPPEDYCDATSAVERLTQRLNVASKEVLEGVYGYWIAKREKKNSALVRVFQFYKPKRTEQLNLKGVLRKKRSFRHRGKRAGRGKQLNFLKAALYDKEDTTTTKKVEEAETAAKQAEAEAVVKRGSAQRLMAVADLLTYKATMALRIAEARATSSFGSVDQLFPGEWLGPPS